MSLVVLVTIMRFRFHHTGSLPSDEQLPSEFLSRWDPTMADHRHYYAAPEIFYTHNIKRLSPAALCLSVRKSMVILEFGDNNKSHSDLRTADLKTICIAPSFGGSEVQGSEAILFSGWYKLITHFPSMKWFLDSEGCWVHSATSFNDFQPCLNVHNSHQQRLAFQGLVSKLHDLLMWISTHRILTAPSYSKGAIWVSPHYCPFVLYWPVVHLWFFEIDFCGTAGLLNGFFWNVDAVSDRKF